MNNQILTELYITNKDHEYISGLTEEELRLLDESRNGVNKLNMPMSIKVKKEFNSYIDWNMGSFYFNFYNSTNKYEGAKVFRFVYICTFMNYKGYIEYGNSKGKCKLAKKSDLMEMLKLKKSEYFYTIKYFEDNKFIEYDEELNVKINNIFCNRGKLYNKDKRKGEYIRMFDNASKELYENSKPREHKNISILLKLIPYVNKETNIICKNPNSQVEDLIPFKQKEILELLNLSDCKTIKSLTNLKILNGEESAFLKISNCFVKNAFVINPRVMFGGNETDIDYLEEILPL